MKNESFASYFVLGTGPSQVKDSAFALESSADAFDNSVGLNNGGEFGFVYSTYRVAWRFGFESLTPTPLSGVSATQGGSEVYQLKSSLTIYAPKVGIEFYLSQTDSFRFLMFGYGSNASLTLKNEYTSVTIAPNADHDIEAKSAANLVGGGFAGEMALFDTTTLIFEVGYRVLKFVDIKYSKDSTTFSGAQTAGSPVLDTNGDPRVIDLSGYYATIGFRFWL